MKRKFNFVPSHIFVLLLLINIRVEPNNTHLHFNVNDYY